MLLLVADFLVSLFAEKERNTFWVIGGVYFFQFVFLMLNLVILAIRMTHTHPFRAGRTLLLVREFKFALITAAVYFFLLLSLRIIGTVILLPCNESELGCNVWRPEYQTFYVLSRLWSIAYYYSFRNAILQLCDSKYYGESARAHTKPRMRYTSPIIGVKFTPPSLYLYHRDQDEGKIKQMKLPIRRLSLVASDVASDMMKRHSEWFRNVQTAQVERMIQKVKDNSEAHNIAAAELGLRPQNDQQLAKPATDPPRRILETEGHHNQNYEANVDLDVILSEKVIDSSVVKEIEADRSSRTEEDSGKKSDNSHSLGSIGINSSVGSLPGLKSRESLDPLQSSFGASSFPNILGEIPQKSVPDSDGSFRSKDAPVEEIDDPVSEVSLDSFSSDDEDLDDVLDYLDDGGVNSRVDLREVRRMSEVKCVGTLDKAVRAPGVAIDALKEENTSQLSHDEVKDEGIDKVIHANGNEVTEENTSQLIKSPDEVTQEEIDEVTNAIGDKVSKKNAREPEITEPSVHQEPENAREPEITEPSIHQEPGKENKLTAQEGTSNPVTVVYSDNDGEIWEEEDVDSLNLSDLDEDGNETGIPSRSKAKSSLETNSWIKPAISNNETKELEVQPEKEVSEIGESNSVGTKESESLEQTSFSEADYLEDDFGGNTDPEDDDMIAEDILDDSFDSGSENDLLDEF
ncbi:MAG: hypothetical protein SGCHY_002022 [Lobulomycetales sp.]